MLDTVRAVGPRGLHPLHRRRGHPVHPGLFGPAATPARRRSASTPTPWPIPRSWPRPRASSAPSAWSWPSTPSGTVASSRSIRTAAGAPPAWTPWPGPSGAVALGAGEILLTSMDADGTKAGLRPGAHPRRRGQRRGAGHRLRRRGLRGGLRPRAHRGRRGRGACRLALPLPRAGHRRPQAGPCRPRHPGPPLSPRKKTARAVPKSDCARGFAWNGNSEIFIEDFAEGATNRKACRIYLRRCENLTKKKKGKALRIALIVVAAILVCAIGGAVWLVNYIANRRTRFPSCAATRRTRSPSRPRRPRPRRPARRGIGRHPDPGTHRDPADYEFSSNGSTSCSWARTAASSAWRRA